MKLKSAFWIGFLPCLFAIITGAVPGNSTFFKAIDPADDLMARRTCTAGFINVRNHCYHFSPDIIRNWDDALRRCRLLDPKSHLVEIETEQEWKIINTYLNEEDYTNHNWWIGASDRDDEGEWLWVGSDSPVKFKNWCKDNPTERETHNCVVITKGDLTIIKKGLCWLEYHCTKNPTDDRLRYICEQ